MGDVTEWLHDENAYFEILMDEVYGTGDGPTNDDDDAYRGYGTFGNDDGANAGWTGPQSSSGKTRKGRKQGDQPNAGPKPPSASKASAVRLGGVTKLAADVYGLPSLKEGQAYAAPPDAAAGQHCASARSPGPAGENGCG